MSAPFPSPTQKWHDTAYPSISPKRPELSARGKTVLITGGGTGIGAETASRFAEAGASRIAILGRRQQPLLDTKASIEQRYPGVKVFPAPADITKKGEVDVAFARFLGDKKLDVLVSNAAKTGPPQAIEDVDGEAYLAAIQFNLQGSLYVAQAFLRHAASDAVTIDVNSSAAHVNFSTQFSSYSVAKLAVFRLWDTLAFAHPSLRIYHIQPGIVDTDMNKEAGGVAAAGFEDHVSLPGSFIVWLASPEAHFLKSKYLWANWDVDELKARAEELEATPQLSIGLVGWPFQDAGYAGGGWNFKTSDST